jgi:hypothetical protein
MCKVGFSEIKERLFSILTWRAFYPMEPPLSGTVQCAREERLRRVQKFLAITSGQSYEGSDGKKSQAEQIRDDELGPTVDDKDAFQKESECQGGKRCHHGPQKFLEVCRKADSDRSLGIDRKNDQAFD